MADGHLNRTLAEHVGAQAQWLVACHARSAATAHWRMRSAHVGYAVRVMKAMATVVDVAARLNAAGGDGAEIAAPFRLPALPPFPEQPGGYPSLSHFLENNRKGIF